MFKKIVVQQTLKTPRLINHLLKRGKMKTETFMRILLMLVVAFSIVGLVMAYGFNKNLHESQQYREKMKDLKSLCIDGNPTDDQVNIPFCKCVAAKQPDSVCVLLAD